MADKKTLEKTTGSLFDSNWNEVVAEKDLGSVGTDELVSKRVSVWGIVSFVIAIFSIFSFLNIGFIALSVLAIVFAIFSLITIASVKGEIVGRSFAYLGLALGLITAIGGPVRAETYRAGFEVQADQFCRSWFDHMQKGEIELARSMQESYWSRPPIFKEEDKVGYWQRVKGREDETHHAAHTYLSNPLMLTLVALGDRAQVSFYEVIATTISDRAEKAAMCYAVTVPPTKEGEKKQTFFLKFIVERQKTKTEEGEKLVGLNFDSVEPKLLKLLPDGRPDYND